METIDNINIRLGDSLKKAMGEHPASIRIAASCFSIYAYEALKTELESVEELRFIFTAPAFTNSPIAEKMDKERREFFIPQQLRENNLYGSEFEIRLKNELTQRAIARECADWIKRKAKFKSNKTSSPMQNFMCVDGSHKSAYLPLNGFSSVDLGYEKGNAISNFVTRIEDFENSAIYWQLFDRMWHDENTVEDVTEKIIEHIATIYSENSPEFIYFLVLYNIFSEFLEDISEDYLPNDRTGYQDSLIWKKLFNFQRDAAIGIINKLERYSGCILADSVGLGKTFTALAVINYYELRNKSVLVLCPKKLTDNWINYNQNLVTNIFAQDRFDYTVLCHTDLQRETGFSNGIPLDKINWGNFDLLVIDESHNFRNNDAYKGRETRYQKLLNNVIRSGVKTKVLMLSATPVNNRFNDLRNQLLLAYEGDLTQLGSKLNTEKPVNEIFRQAQAVFNSWSKLPPEERSTEKLLDSLDFDFFELLDSVTIARSRKHIQKFYDTSDIGKFPERLKPVSLHSPLTDLPDAIKYDAIFKQLIKMNMSIYTPFRYILDSRAGYYENLYDTVVQGGLSRLKQIDREKSLRALLTVNLLKRLESSVAAFRITLEKLDDNIAATLARIDEYKRTGKDAEFSDRVFEADDDADDDFDMDSIGKVIKIRLRDMDLESWSRFLLEDRQMISGLLYEMKKIGVNHDSKLKMLRNIIDQKIISPINPGNKKILIFTAFADTANYLYEHLHDYMTRNYQLHTAKVSGTGHNHSTLKNRNDFQTILTLFSPVSKDRKLIMPEVNNEIDLLIATDCISEGQNLQDCDYLINYDIHWNPVRIIQRFGRIDRIGSKNDVIQLVNFWPDMSLDEYINLKSRVEDRMVMTNVSATGDENLLSVEANDLAFRKEQLQRLQNEVIDLEDLKTGVSITDLGLNDFRMDLIGYINSNGNLAHVPRGLHAVAPANPDKGILPGTIFVLHNRNAEININQQNRLHPYYLVYIGNDGQVIVNHAQVKKILDLFRAACKNFTEPVPELCRIFNKETRDGRRMDRYSSLLAKSIKSIISVKAEKDIDSLFSAGGTTALRNCINGLNDFELVAFLVIRNQDSGGHSASGSQTTMENV